MTRAKLWIIGLGVVSVLLAALCVALAALLYQRPRFSATNGNNPYIMFDSKTDQACWAGPLEPAKQNSTSDELLGLAPAATSPLDAYPPSEEPPRGSTHNPARLPFCKNLK